jgi:hypothetical protein
MEAEIESLLKPGNLKHDASEESQKTMKALRGNAESALKHSRSLLSDAYEEVKTAPAKPASPPATTPRNTLDHRRCGRWRPGLLAAYLLCRRN